MTAATLPTAAKSYAPIVALLQRARDSGLQWPKLRLALDGVELKFTLAGPTARVPGSVNVASPERYPAGTWYGRVMPNGSWIPAHPAYEGITSILDALAADPAGTAAAHGRRCGRCCFCDAELTDERSIAVGYGPTCAGHWGLPWGQE